MTKMKIWEVQPEEPRGEAEAWTIYRDSPAPRSLKGLAEQLCVPADTIYNYSHEWSWDERLNQYMAHQAKAAARAAESQAVKLARKHLKLTAKVRQPGRALATCHRSVRPCIAMSSLSLEVSIPAVVMLFCVIFVDPAL